MAAWAVSTLFSAPASITTTSRRSMVHEVNERIIVSAFYGPKRPDNERLALLDKCYELGEWNWDSGKGLMALLSGLGIVSDHQDSGHVRR
jgi:hypothetical protein